MEKQQPNDGVVILDSEGIIVMANRYSAAIFHTTPKEMLNNSITTYIPKIENRGSIIDVMKSAVQQKEGEIFEAIGQRASDTAFRLSITMDILPDQYDPSRYTALLVPHYWSCAIPTWL
jgi:PAS domain-containing protein